MSLETDIDKLLNNYTQKWANDLEKSLFDALKKGGRGNPNPPDIEFKGGVVYGAGSVKLQVYANKDYWYYIENGRKKGSMPPTKALGKDWQAKNGISPSQIIYEMTLEYNKKKGLTKRKVTKLPFAKAAKQFAFIVARSIKIHGIKPRPFIDKGTNDNDLKVLITTLSQMIGKEVTVK